MTKRNDIHSPKNIIPTDYEFVVMRSHEDEKMGGAAYAAKIFSDHMKTTGGKFSQHEHGGECMVCGAYMIDYAIFHHVPTNTYIRTGCDCADKIETGLTDLFRRQAQLRRAAEKRAQMAEQISADLQEMGVLEFAQSLFYNGDMASGLSLSCGDNADLDMDELEILFGDTFTALPDYHQRSLDSAYFTALDMVRNLVKFGSWSDNQKKFFMSLSQKLSRENVDNLVAQAQQAKEAAVDAPEGRVVVVGEVAGLKWQDSMYGSTLKMLVKADAGYKVWTTVPASISEVKRGQRIEFTVTLTPKEDDRSFAIGKRPSKATIIESEGE